MTRRTRYWGVRTFGMLLCAWIWVLIGIGAFFDVSKPHPGVFHLLIPADIRAWAWMITAWLAVIFAWSRRLSPIAIGALFLMPGLNMISYTVGWIAYLLPGGSRGYSAGWYAAALYLALVGLVILCALIPSPPAKVVTEAG